MQYCAQRGTALCGTLHCVCCRSDRCQTRDGLEHWLLEQVPLTQNPAPATTEQSQPTQGGRARVWCGQQISTYCMGRGGGSWSAIGHWLCGDSRNSWLGPSIFSGFTRLSVVQKLENPSPMPLSPWAKPTSWSPRCAIQTEGRQPSIPAWI
jgi:hypothetical protein